MLPQLGDIVHYRLSETDVAEINRGVDPIAISSRRNPVSAGEYRPAIVVGTFGGSTVNLRVLLDGAGEFWATSRPNGSTECTWTWPPPRS